MSTILLVDDEPSIRLSLSEILRDEGHTVSTAENGREALEKLQNEPFAILLTDISMPVMDGIELAREVSAKYPDILTVLFTGQGTLENATQALRIGVFDFLLKPVKKKDLLDSIAQVERVQKLNVLNQKLFQENEKYRSELEERIREQSVRLTMFSEQLLTMQDRLRKSILPRIRDMVHKPVQDILATLKKEGRKDPEFEAFRKNLHEFLSASLDPFRTNDPFDSPDTSLETAIRKFTGAFNRNARSISINRLAEPADIQSRTHIYYAIREALTNAVKHSGADSITIDSKETGDKVVYTITDNGHGFSGMGVTDNRGIGLLLMKERAEMAGGTFNLLTRENSGTTISIIIPQMPEKATASPANTMDS